MRYSRRFLIMAGVILLAVLIKYNGLYADVGRISPEGDAEIETSVWYEKVAEDYAGTGISLYLGDDEILDKDSGIYMDKNLNLMIPLSDVQDVFECSARVYENKKLLVMKYEDELTDELGQFEATLNGEDYSFGSGLTKKDGSYYVPVANLATALGYSYYWNASDSEIRLVNLCQGKEVLPVSFDLRTVQRTSKVKNQGMYGTCWAFAALSSLESTLLPESSYEFSPDHMAIHNGFSIRQETGGAYSMSMAYLAAWQGPVLESEDSYGDGASPDNLLPAVHVQEMQILPDRDLEAIKRAVFFYGGVQCSFYNDLNNAFDESPYYNSETCAYYYNGEEAENHQIVIIGWDDEYAKENFATEPENDGAFLCQNSWGENFGDNGVFYVSYEDALVGTNTVAFTKVEGTDNYDHIYQADLCGAVGQIGYDKESVWAANVYEAENSENVCAAGFYTAGENTSYEIYVVSEFERTDSLQYAEPVASGICGYAGYYTIPFEREVEVSAGKDFAIMIRIKTPNEEYPMSVEYRANDLTRSVILSDGEGYVSRDGKNWENTESTYQCNLCLKAFTKNCQEEEK